METISKNCLNRKKPIVVLIDFPSILIHGMIAVSNIEGLAWAIWIGIVAIILSDRRVISEFFKSYIAAASATNILPMENHAILCLFC